MGNLNKPSATCRDLATLAGAEHWDHVTEPCRVGTIGYDWRLHGF